MKRENINLFLMIIVILIPLISFIIMANSIYYSLLDRNSIFIEMLEKSESLLEKSVTIICFFPFTAEESFEVLILNLITLPITFFSITILIAARLIIKNKNKKNTYKILMTIVYAPYTLLEWILIFVLSFKYSILIHIIMILSLGINYYNTYSNKMYTVEESEKIEDPVEVEEEKEK